MSSNHTFFTVADYCMFGATIVVSLGIGVYYALSGGKQQTTSEYFVGNRRMKFLPVAVSLLVSFESSIMMLGIPAEIYVYGLQWLLGVVFYALTIAAATFVVVPMVHQLKITSVYEYLELRFKSRAVRTLGTVIGMINTIAYMGIVLFGPAIALEGVTGFPQWGSIVSVASASVLYTSIGGLKAVIWTDVFQFIVMFTGVFAVLIKGTIEVGGIHKTWEIAYNNGRVNMFNFDPDPTIRHTFWCLFVGNVIKGCWFIFNQSSVQRISSTPTVQKAKMVTLYVAPGILLTMTLAAVEGVIAFAYYETKRCDPLSSKQISNPNQIIPFMVMELFENLKGMPGLFMASLFSASLSTLSSCLSSMSAMFWTDIVKPHVRPMSELRATVISKISVFVFGGLAVFMAFMITLIGGTLVQITGSILLAIGGPLAGLFLFGIFCPFANAKGAFFGSVLSTAVTSILCIGQMVNKWAVTNTRLSPAPVDFCPEVNSSFLSHLMNDSSISDMSGDVMSVTMNMLTSTIETDADGDIPNTTGFIRLFTLSYQYFGAVGVVQVFVYGTIISYFTGFTKPEDIDRRTVVSFCDALCPFLPECIRKSLRCGYNEVFDASISCYNVDVELSEQDVNNAEVESDHRESQSIKLLKDNSIANLDKNLD